MIILLNILQWLLYLFFLMGTIYLFVFAMAGLLYKPSKQALSVYFNRIVVLIPGYKEDDVILEVVQKALDQDYPKDFYDIIIIADSFRKDTLDRLKTMNLNVKEVRFEKSSKAKSLNVTLDELSDEYDFILILDADNIIAPDFISKMNLGFNNGFVAIQGHRLAKNLNTHYAILDALSEEINNNIFRRGHRRLGLSAALIGSGMGFDFQLYKSLMSQVESYGEDKELEHKLLKRGITIEYLEEALVYDEKITLSEVFVNQRTRWIANQLNYVKSYFKESITELLYGNFDYFDKIVQHLLPPRIFMLGFLSLFVLLSLIVNSANWNWAWFIQWTLCVSALLVSVPKHLRSFNSLIALFYLPFGFFLMLVSLSRINHARKGFIHTSHDFSEHNIK